MTQKNGFLTDVRFDSFDLPPEILAGLKDAGYTFCTPIQAETVPITLEGHDVAGQAQTGTGKTAAFLVPILTRMLEEKDRPEGLAAALIVAPTRELALQIFDETKIIGGHTPFKVAQVIGGIDYRKQADILRAGADIVICTPGRVIDYIKQGVLKTEAINYLVIDEADRLFDLGFTDDMRYILRRLPHYEKRQSMLFSATLSYRVLELTYHYMNLPEVVTIEAETVTVEAIDQSLFHVGSREKFNLLLGLLSREDWSRVLIFSNTKRGVDMLARRLKKNGYPAHGISGDLPQPKRLKLMGDYKSGKITILVATDVASRGIHVEDISHVFNYDIPQDAENYVHRIGRTARAGKKGRALTFACEDYVAHLEPVEKLLGFKIPVTWPEDDWFEEDRRRPMIPAKPEEETEKPAETEAAETPQESPSKKRRRRRKKKPATDRTETRSEAPRESPVEEEAPKSEPEPEPIPEATAAPAWGRRASKAEPKPEPKKQTKPEPEPEERAKPDSEPPKPQKTKAKGRERSKPAPPKAEPQPKPEPALPQKQANAPKKARTKPGQVNIFGLLPGEMAGSAPAKNGPGEAKDDQNQASGDQPEKPKPKKKPRRRRRKPAPKKNAE